MTRQRVGWVLPCDRGEPQDIADELTREANSVFGHYNLGTTYCVFIVRVAEILNGNWKFPDRHPIS
jgi:hypothetical protein